MTEFNIGDMVRCGTRVATVTDVGTILVEIRTTVGASRVVCPWELVRLRAVQRDRGVAVSATETTR